MSHRDGASRRQVEVGGRGTDADPDDEILTSRQARELLKIGRTKLWELTHGQAIPAYRIGSGDRAGLRYKRSELLAWLERNRL